MLSPTRITPEYNGKIRAEPDRENAFARASGGGVGIRTEGIAPLAQTRKFTKLNTMPTTITWAIHEIMDAYDAKYWNLCQAAVWIEFRDRKLVEQFATPPGQVPDGEAYRALHFYPSMWPPERVLHADLNELLARLKSNSLKALGYHPSEPDLLQTIPPEQWQDINLRPPEALDARIKNKKAWSLVRVKRADILRLWPLPSEALDRSWFDWDEIRKLYDEVRADFPNESENQTILEIRARFEKRRKVKPPSRAALQTRIKQWKTAAS